MRGLVAAALLLFAGDAAAQQTSTDVTVQPGSRVRVMAMDSLRVTGRVEAINDERLFVAPRRGIPVSISLASIDSLHVSRGHRSRTGQGAVLGALLAGSVAYLGALSHEPSANSPRQRVEEGTVLFALAAIPGALVGAAVGFLASPERWVRAPVPGR
ncbi:MAG TPA: hypothetical protein VF665_08440 [Longimicrobium sp.]|uniref:hypothetical protein n=1 Tax=Longimicrobium sp. TaxID=2029185 RepID=UPI002ED9FC10